METSLKLPAVFEYQRRALFGPERYAVVEGSTKCGKTFPCLVWLLTEHLHTKANQAVWWVAPIFQQAKMAFRRVTVEMLGACDPGRKLWTCSESELWVSVHGFGRIWFKSADNPEGLYGEDVYAAVVDEATRCSDQSWYALRSTITATRARARIIGNVRGRKNWAYIMARRAESGADGMTYHKITADDAIECGLLDPREIEQARLDLPHAIFRELYYCEPSEDAGNPFGIQHIAACTVAGLGAGPAVAFGVDLARQNDYTVVVGLNKEGRVCYFDRVNKTSWEAIIGRITTAVGRTPGRVDSAGIGDPLAERLQRDCPKLERYNTASEKRNLIEGLIVDIQQRKVSFPDGPIRQELDAYEYQPTKLGRVGYGSPDGLHDDCVTALALAAKQLDAGRSKSAPYVSLGTANRLEAVWGDD